MRSRSDAEGGFGHRSLRAVTTYAPRQNNNMNDLNKQALRGLFGFVLTLAFCVFVPAWTVDYWQAWVLLSVLSVSLLAITLYLMKKD
jgi:cell division protein FtsW (lipid II flippase)